MLRYSERGISLFYGDLIFDRPQVSLLSTLFYFLSPFFPSRHYAIYLCVCLNAKPDEKPTTLIIRVIINLIANFILESQYFLCNKLIKNESSP